MRQTFLLLCAALALAIARPVKAEDISSNFVISDFASTVSLAKDGTSSVEEKITADFGQNPHHGIYRTLPTKYNSLIYGRRSSGINISSVSINQLGQPETGVPYTTSTGLSGINLKIGDPNQTLTGNWIYTIRYTAGAVHKRESAADVYLWNVTGADWVLPIQKATVTITAPAAWQSSQCFAPAGEQSDCQVSHSGQTITASATNLTPGNQLTAGGNLPADTLTAPSPVGVAMVTQIALPFAIPLIVLIILIRARQKIRARLHGKSIVPEFDPPTLEPALADAFIDGDLTGEPLPASIIDMASKGELTIAEKKGFLDIKDYEITLAQAPNIPERPVATTLAALLFAGREKFTLGLLKRDPALARTITTKPAENGWDWLIKQGYFSAKDDWNTATILGLVVGIIMLGGSFVGAAGLLVAGFSIFWLIALGLTGFILLFTRLFYKGGKLTDKGLETWRQVQGFKLFMHTAERYRQQWTEKQGELDKLLPWAMVFGLTKEWLHKLEQMNIQFTQPVWYVGTGHFDSSNFSSGFTAAMTSFSNAGTSSGGAGGGGGGGGGGGW